MYLATPSALKKLGIMGMNARNVGFVAKYNPRHRYPLVDNKLKTKLLAQQSGIAVPELLGTIQFQHDVKRANELIAPHDQFVIKPAKGSGGKGILVIAEKEHEVYFKPSGESLTLDQVERHISNILSGLYSLGGAQDTAMIEAMVQFDAAFDAYSYEGIPDIRVIIFMGFPVMAMLRLATHSSDGKANLHQGAVGVGIDLSNGQALHAVQHNRPVFKHPDTGQMFNHLRVPHWEKILPLAAACYEMTGLGYLGVDIVLDKNLGPLIIELNARPGLAIQVANGSGLAPRLEKIIQIKNKTMDPSQRAKYSQDLFGNASPPENPGTS